MCWLSALTLVVVAGGAILSLAAPAAIATSTNGNKGFVIYVPAHGEIIHVGASFMEPTPVVSNVGAPTPVPVQTQTQTSSGWWGYCCTGDHSTHNTGSVPLQSPWGPPPITTNSSAIEQYLFNQINHDRAIRGLYLYSWNSTLANGARLHSWNMHHCGFSHSCPDGDSQFRCMRITYEFPNNNDCGEWISSTVGDGRLANQESKIGLIQTGMVNETDSPTSLARIHFTSHTLHRVRLVV